MSEGGVEAQQKRETDFIRQIKTLPIAINTPDANTQHYEVPTEFYDLCLGKNKKYRYDCLFTLALSAVTKCEYV